MEISIKEQRVRKITHLYYSKPEVQKVLFEFSKNREISPRYFEGFGKRPDAFQYKNDVFELVKRGATSFHCSEELWEDPLQIETGMNAEQFNEIRIGWDLLIDIDCKWFDYSKLAAKAVIKVLENHKIKNFGLKFSGSKGWHIIVPWKAFPKELNGEKTKDMFPDLPRKIMGYIIFEAEKELKKLLPEDFYEQFKNVKIKRGIKCNQCSEIANEYEFTTFFCKRCGIEEQRKLEVGNKNLFKCSNCNKEFDNINIVAFYECNKCNINSRKNPENFSRTIQEDLFELMGLDLILVSPRHLFRMPYSLHEKTALSSIVISPEELDNFHLKDADAMSVKIRNFIPEVKEGEASELVMFALDWYSMNKPNESSEKIKGKYANFKPIELKNLTDDNLPPCIKKVLEGLSDGKKRALFVLINLFRSVGMEKEEMEKKIYEWNKKNTPPLKEGYIKSQLEWSYRKKPIMPPNCKEFYHGLGACLPEQMCTTIKNPVNFVVKKNFFENRKLKYKSKKDGREKKKEGKVKKENIEKVKINKVVA